MSYYIHHVPGRLRVKTLAVKRNEHLARVVKGFLADRQGVSAVDVNSVTGSIVVNYDKRILSSDAILRSLREMGYIHEVSPDRGDRGMVVALQQDVSAYSQPLTDAVVTKFSETVVNKLVEIVLERSAMALIALFI